MALNLSRTIINIKFITIQILHNVFSTNQSNRPERWFRRVSTQEVMGIHIDIH